jgi:hypothetical protein
MLLKSFWVVARRQFLVYTKDPEDGTNKCSRNVGYTPKIDAGLQPKTFQATLPVLLNNLVTLHLFSSNKLKCKYIFLNISFHRNQCDAAKFIERVLLWSKLFGLNFATYYFISRMKIFVAVKYLLYT